MSCGEHDRKYPEIVVVRHAETVWNKERRFQGRLDSPLTMDGEAQARALASVLREAGLPRSGWRVLASPATRVLATAAIALPGVALRTDPRLLELGLGDWEGRKTDEVRGKEQPPGVLGWQFAAPGGEPREGFVGRCRSFLDELDGPVLILTHGLTGRMIRSLWLGGGIEEANDLPGGQGNAFHLRDGRMVELRP